MSNKRFSSEESNEKQTNDKITNNNSDDDNSVNTEDTELSEASVQKNTNTESSFKEDSALPVEIESLNEFSEISSGSKESSNTNEQLLLTEQNIETIFDDDVLDLDDTVFSDETVVLIQYIPENDAFIETEYNDGTFTEILENEFSSTFTVKEVLEEQNDGNDLTQADITSAEPDEDEQDAKADQDGTDDEEDEARLEQTLKKRRKKKIIRRIIKSFISVLCVLLIAVGALMVYYYDLLNAMIYKDLEDTAPSSQQSHFNFSIPIESDSSAASEVSSATISSEAVSDWTIDISDGTTLLNDPMVLNVMLFGSDTRYEGYTGNSDTMILLSLDNRHRKIKFTSFMRDTWINIPGYGANKMNAAYSFGGPSLAIETIQRNYGIKIDRYAIVDFASFTEIIDSIGGIDIELTEFEIDYINWQMYENDQVDDRHYIKAEPGIVHLDGREALWHARNRDSALSDFDRTGRQRQVITTVLNSFKDSSLTTILDIVSKVGPMITTNLRKSEITTLVKNSLTYLSYDQEECTLPDISSDNIIMANSFPTQYGNLDVLLIPDWQKARRDIAGFIFEDSLIGYTKPESEASESSSSDVSTNSP